MKKLLVLFGLSLLMACAAVQASTTILSSLQVEELGSVALANGDTLQVVGGENHIPWILPGSSSPVVS